MGSTVEPRSIWLAKRDAMASNVPPHPRLRPPQFGLRTMLSLVALVAILLAARHVIGPIGAFVMLLAVLAVSAHVAGGALGTQLRSIGDTEIGPDGLPARRRSAQSRVAPSNFAPATNLRESRSLGRPLIVFTLLGAMVGAVVGSWLLWLANGDRSTISSVVLGATSFGVLGGLWGFWVSSLLQVVWSAWSQADQESPTEARLPHSVSASRYERLSKNPEARSR